VRPAYIDGFHEGFFPSAMAVGSAALSASSASNIRYIRPASGPRFSSSRVRSRLEQEGQGVQVPRSKAEDRQEVTRIKACFRRLATRRTTADFTKFA
jgi:hypothetical protein